MTDQPPEEPSDEPRDRPSAPRADDADGSDLGTGGTGGPDGDSAAPKRRLTRGRDHKVLAGVCDGAGRYFDIDPVIFRVVLAVLSLTGGIGLIIYGMGWLVIPLEGERQSEAQRLLSGRIEGAPLTAVLMALVGCGLYASMLDNGDDQAFSLILLAATTGAVYYWAQVRRRQAAGEAASPSGAASAVVDAPPAVQAPPEPGGSASWWRGPLTKEPSYLWGPDDGPYGDEDKVAWRERKRAARKKESSWVFGLTVFVLVVAAGAIGTGAAAPYQSPAVSVEIGLIAVLGVFGLAFVVASFAGRARGGTVFFTLLTLAGLIGTASVPHDNAGWRDTWRPMTAAAVQPTYERGSGQGVLDLTDLTLDGRTVNTRVDLRVGEVLIRLPKDATVRLTYHVAVGAIRLPEKDHGGLNVNSEGAVPVVFAPPAGTMNTGTVNVHVRIGAGDLRIEPATAGTGTGTAPLAPTAPAVPGARHVPVPGVPGPPAGQVNR
ncbi:PspC domain-containing protein [Streptomyces sp. NPDC087422]|uniref:PspC domain-containing protein n=1 Tax=Streptomyces sp. NPDC087422 TaxID=3365786 RepID=UPI0037F9BA82